MSQPLPPVALEQAFAHLGRGEYRAAAEAFAKVLRQRPDLAQAWNGFAAALIGLRDFPRALQAADRALAIDPRNAAAHARRGVALKYLRRFDDAVAAHEAAARLAPSSARARAQLGLALKAAGRMDEAEVRLREALDRDPRLRTAGLDLAVLLVTRGRHEEATVLLRTRLASESDSTAAALLGQIVEDRRMSEAVLRALAEAAPAAIEQAVLQTPPERLAVDEHLLQRLAIGVRPIHGLDFHERSSPGLAVDERLSQRLGPSPARAGSGAADARGGPASDRPWWPWVEAHFNLHRGDDVDAVVASVTAGQAGQADPDLACAARAVAERVALSASNPAGGAQWEARLRWYHAVLAQPHPHWLPGRFKLQPSLVSSNPTDEHGAPDRVAGTLRAFLADIVSPRPPGLERAALILRGIAWMHPFMEANGRIARLLASGECDAAGLGPLVIPQRLRAAQLRAFIALSRGATLEPLVDVLGDALAFSRELLRALERRL